MDNKKLIIDVSLAHRLVADQFPEWKDLPIRPVPIGGWDNRTFRLGEHLLIRMPSDAKYADQIKKEQKWLPRLAPLLPLSIPEPQGIGEPAEGYPWKWSIYRWIEGDTAASAQITDLSDFAKSLAQFLIALQSIDPKDGPLPGPHCFYRGDALTRYDTETREAIATLKGKIDADAATKVWETGVATTWGRWPVWVHGDISPNNLLVKDGELSAVIDFGQLTLGDPACDLAIAWTFFEGQSREVFRAAILPMDPETWARGKGWALWKALIIAADPTLANTVLATQSWHIIDQVLEDRNQKKF
jgi:aminoglycoside phosphotransferase (APT) family kinase protein